MSFNESDILKCVSSHYEYDAKALNYWQAELTYVQKLHIFSFGKSMCTE